MEKVQALATVPGIDQTNDSFGVSALNDSDQAAGWGLDPVTGGAVAFYWDHGKFHNLGNFGGDAQAVKINDDSQILIDGTVNGTEEAFLWKNGKSVSIKPPTGDSLQGRGG